MKRVSFSSVPERPLQYGWKLSSPTPPCHRDRVIVVIVVVIVGCTPPLTIIDCTPPHNISRIRREIRLLTLKGHCSRHSQRICMIKSEDCAKFPALSFLTIKTQIRALFLKRSENKKGACGPLRDRLRPVEGPDFMVFVDCS